MNHEMYNKRTSSDTVTVICMTLFDWRVHVQTVDGVRTVKNLL